MTTQFLTLFKKARRAGTPLVGIRTADQTATIQLLTEAANGSAPVLSWDAVRGLRWQNAAGLQAAWLFMEKPEYQAPPTDGPGLLEFQQELTLRTGNLVEALSQAERLPENTLLFLQNAQRYIDKLEPIQAIANLRDVFKANQRQLVLLGSPAFTLPEELQRDVFLMTEELPDLGQLAEIVAAQYEAAGAEPQNKTEIDRAVDAVCGLAAFPAEQVTAMSFTKTAGEIRLDLPALWERKRTLIDQAPGLSVWRGKETFEDLGGAENIKTFLRRIFEGEEPPRCIVFIDEIEKAMAGTGGGAAGGDSSGTSQEMHGTLLSEMENAGYTGMIFVGPPGCVKSATAKAAGETFGVPTICFDLSGMKSKFVGESNGNLLSALQVVRAVSQGRALFIATCNGVSSLSPELRRRFTFGTFMFDLPTASERKQIWDIYLKKFRVEVKDLPEDTGWTGAEIRQACNLAWRLKCSPREAADYITPVSKVNAETISALRNQANGRFLSASAPGFYGLETVPTVKASGKRSINL